MRVPIVITERLSFTIDEGRFVPWKVNYSAVEAQTFAGPTHMCVRFSSIDEIMRERSGGDRGHKSLNEEKWSGQDYLDASRTFSIEYFSGLQRLVSTAPNRLKLTKTVSTLCSSSTSSAVASDITLPGRLVDMGGSPVFGLAELVLSSD